MFYSSSDESLYTAALWQEKGSITFIAQKPRASLLKSLLDKGGKQAFKNMKAFRKYYGSAGKDMHWHHIVGQHGKNIFQFGAEKIHNAGNIVKIPAKIHSKINAHYASRLPGMPKGMTVRSWLSKFPMDVQYKYGVQIMRKYGVGM
jgi:hypothetical protein